MMLPRPLCRHRSLSPPPLFSHRPLCLHRSAHRYYAWAAVLSRRSPARLRTSTTTPFAHLHRTSLPHRSVRTRCTTTIPSTAYFAHFLLISFKQKLQHDTTLQDAYNVCTIQWFTFSFSLTPDSILLLLLLYHLYLYLPPFPLSPASFSLSLRQVRICVFFSCYRSIFCTMS